MKYFLATIIIGLIGYFLIKQTIGLIGDIKKRRKDKHSKESEVKKE